MKYVVQNENLGSLPVPEELFSTAAETYDHANEEVFHIKYSGGLLDFCDVVTTTCKFALLR
jgi:hypothetical protein